MTLKKYCSLALYPIYIDSDLIEPEQSIMPLELSQVCSTKYDIVLQHAPLEYLFPFANLDCLNYCIPIIKYSKNTQSKHLDTLNSFNTILSDSKYDSDFISNLASNSNKLKKIKLFSYTNYYEDNKQVNMYQHNKNYKLYTFVNQSNVSDIYNILLAFFTAYQDISDCSLVLVTDTENTANKTKNILDNLLKNVKLNSIQNYIKIIIMPQQAENIATLHRTCDCYIEFRSYTNSHFHTFLAKECNNAYITNENLDISYEPSVNTETSSIDILPILSISSLVTKIKNTVRTKPIHKVDNIPTLDKIICK
jgi:hypothetical protein